MITVYEAVIYRQAEIVRTIERTWGPIKVEAREEDPEDDPNFRFFDRLMREKPRSGRG